METDTALRILRVLSDGIDPVTGEVFPPESPYQRADTIRALLKAVDALKTIGTGYDLRNKYWWGHAIIGVKGAAAGTALESAGKELSQMVSVGNPPDLALVFDYIELKGQ